MTVKPGWKETAHYRPSFSASDIVRSPGFQGKTTRRYITQCNEQNTDKQFTLWRYAGILNYFPLTD